MRAALISFALVVVGCGPTATQHSGDDTQQPDAATAPACTAGESRACYTGDPSTQNVGPCTGGTQTCDASGNWGPCQGEVVPKGEVCANSVDDNCNGTVDEDIFPDACGYCGDGVTVCSAGSLLCLGGARPPGGICP
jgi:hypothetical protein